MEMTKHEFREQTQCLLREVSEHDNIEGIKILIKFLDLSPKDNMPLVVLV